MAFDTKDMSIFFSDFAVDITPTTWGTGVFSGIFDTDYVDLDEISREAPYFITEASNVPGSAVSGDLFTINSVSYKLVDIQVYELGAKRIILANV